MSPTQTEARPEIADEPADHGGEPATWSIGLRNGLSLSVPARLDSLSTYVLLEQEAWFEPEMSLLPHLLGAATNALDIGANHGAYALEMALLCRQGRVIAFEPTSAPRQALQRSVRHNGLSERLTVVAAALGEAEGTASFQVGDNSELNSRGGNNANGGRRETVRVTTLDGYLAAHAPGLPFGFVKLDAEGDELRVLEGGRQFFATQSPVVLFEFKHGASDNLGLVDAMKALGFDIFRWSAELELLLPFDPACDDTQMALNLVAVRPRQQQDLAQRGLLVTALAARQVLLPEPALPALQAWCARPALLGQHVADAAALRREIVEAAGEAYTQALCAVASAHLQPDLTAAERLALVIYAHELLLGASKTAAGLQPAGWALVVHCLLALGRPGQAVAMARQLLKHWPAAAAGTVAVPSVPPRRQDLERQRSSDSGSWLRQMLAEFAACQGAYSSYFEPPAPQAWAELLRHPDHGVAVERRCLLVHMRANRVPAPEVLARLERLTQPRHTVNAPLWQGLLASMRALQPASAPVAAPAAAPPSPAQVLGDMAASLLPAPLQIVDVGACTHGAGTEPYAALTAAVPAQVLGFEPDARALAELERSFPDRERHRFLPHLVGNGARGVFHATAWSQTASLLAPNRAMLDRYQRVGELVQETGRSAVSTVRLDDVVPPGAMDLLKIDVQGGEGRVFDGAAQRLSECLMVWTEVEFVPLYDGQPLFAEIDQQLRRHGLQFLRFVNIVDLPLASWGAAGKRLSQQAPAPGLVVQASVAKPPGSQQLWADAIFVPTADRIAAMDPLSAARLALLAHHVAQAYDLCHAALLQVDRLAGGERAAAYLEAMAAAG